MSELAPTPRLARAYRFDDFVFDPRTGELRSKQRRTRLTAQLAELLQALVERPSELVTRDELRRRIWPADREVDFAHGLTAAINRLREALGDSPRTPRFIETIPRRGYRWLVPVQVEGEALSSGQPSAPVAVPVPGRASPRLGSRGLGWAVAVLALLLAAAFATAWYRTARGGTYRPPAAAAEAYAKGQFHAARRTDADLAEAAAYFRRAIALDPAFAAAHAGLAAALAQRVYDGSLLPVDALAEARREAREALRLGPDLGEPHVAMGSVQFQADWDWQGAETAYRRALEIEPDSTSAMRGLARLLEARGRFDEAIALRAEMVELDPVSRSARFGLAGAYMDARRSSPRPTRPAANATWRSERSSRRRRGAAPSRRIRFSTCCAAGCMRHAAGPTTRAA